MTANRTHWPVNYLSIPPNQDDFWDDKWQYGKNDKEDEQEKARENIEDDCH